MRRAVALAMGRLGGAGAADALVNALAFDDGKDVYLRDGLVRAIESLGKPGIDALLALADSGVHEGHATASWRSSPPCAPGRPPRRCRAAARTRT